MKKANTTIYQFINFDFNFFVETYLELQRPKEEITSVTMDGQYTSTITLKRGIKNRERIVQKCKYLQDVIIRRAYMNVDMAFSLNSQLLKSVIGNDYKLLLTTFSEMGYISTDEASFEHYELGKYATRYYLLKRDFLEETICNFRIQDYITNAKSYVLNYRTDVIIPRIDNCYSREFRLMYEAALSRFTIADKDKWNEFITQNHYDDKNSKTYIYINDIYKQMVSKKKEIYNIDTSHRLYHILTLSRKDIRKYFNISYTIDCKNCHPLLFCYFIISKYTDDNNQILLVIKEIKNNYTINLSTHNVERNLNNSLKNNILEKMEDDEIAYIYETSTGQLWDNIAKENPQYERTTIKTTMFKQVFYSQSATTRNKPFAKIFKARYPSVYDLITRWKEPDESIKKYLSTWGLYSAKSYAALPLALMNLEARIFTDVLKELYKTGYQAVNLHDCIVVPSVKSHYPKENYVKGVMEWIFAKYGLSPTFDIEHFSSYIK